MQPSMPLTVASVTATDLEHGGDAMAHRTRALAVLVLTLPLAAGCARPTSDQRVSEVPPPAVPAPGALIPPPAGAKSLTEGTAPVPIPGRPPVTVTGVVDRFDPGTAILTFEDGRMVKLTPQSTVTGAGNPRALQPGERVV